jgi:Poly(R)-hydroxyalkanoic acid synthase subunit (PHA_synth_III_E)
MESNNFFNSWLETQKQLMDNFTESNRKLQDAVKNGSASKEGMNIYQEWLNKQSEITKTAGETATKNVQAQVNETTETFKTATGTAEISEIYNNWMKTQKEMNEKAFESFRQFSQPFTSNNPFSTEAFNQANSFQQQWWNTTQNFMKQPADMNQWFAPFQNMNKGFNTDFIKDTWNSMTNMSTAYAKFNEMWGPALKNMTGNTFNAEWMKNSFNPEAFRELMDKTSASFAPVQYKELYQQFQSWVEVVTNYNKHIYQQFGGNIPEAGKNLFPFLMFGNDPQNASNNIFSMYQRTLSPLVKLLNPGKEAELNEQMNLMGEKIVNYGQKLAEVQQHVYATGAKSWENFLNDSFEQVKKGADLSNTRESFQQWVNKNEEMFTTLFRGEEYSKLQGELLDLGLNIRQSSEKVGEILLQPLPVVLRSEADELYTTIYELRKRISTLEKQVGETTSETKEVKSSKKKAATA